MKRRVSALLVAEPADSGLVRIKGQVLDARGNKTRQGFTYEPQPWASLVRGLVITERTRTRSEQLLQQGQVAPLGKHLLTLDLPTLDLPDDSSTQN